MSQELAEECRKPEARLKVLEAERERLAEQNEQFRQTNQQLRQEKLERQRIEQALRESEERYRTLVESSPNAIAVHAAGRVVFVNPEAVRLMGASSAGELLGRPVLEFVHPDFREIARRRVQAIYDKKTPADPLEERFMRLDDQMIEVEVVGTMVDYGGKPASQIVFRDITDRKRAEAALQENLARLSGLIDNLQMGVLVEDEARRVLHLNQTFCDLFGVEAPPHSLIGADCGEAAEAVKPLFADPVGFVRGIEARLAAQEKVMGEKLVLVDGRIFERDYVPILMNEEHHNNLWLYRDITARVQAEEALREQNSFHLAIIKRAAEGLCVCHDISAYPYVAFTEWNERMTEITGYTLEEINEQGWYQTVYPDPEVQARAVERMARMRQGDDLRAEEWEIMRADGEKRTLAISTSVLESDDRVKHVLALMEDISDRKRAEETLRESEERFRELADLLPQVVYEANVVGVLTYANRRAFELFGYTRQEFEQGLNALQMLVPEERARATEAIQEILMGKEPASDREFRALRKDGGTFPVAIYSSPIVRQGRAVGLRGIIVDISERKQTEEALQESEAKFRSIIESTPIGMHMYQLEPDGRLVFTGANPAADEILGVDNEQFVGQTIEEAFPALTETEVPESYRKVAAEGTTWGTEQILYEENQIKGAFEVRAFQTSPGRMVAAFLEITERKRAEEEIRRRNRELVLLNQAMEQTAESVVITDTGGTILYVNPAFERITGYSRAEAVGQNPRILKSGKHDAAFYQELWATISAGEVWQGRLVNKKKDGTLYTEEGTITPVRDKRGAILNFVQVKRDVTHELALEEHYRQAQKMEAIGQLAGGVAHDFNNILTAIMGCASLPLDLNLLPPGHPVRSDLQSIQQNAERAASLTRQLLTFARRQIVEPRVLNLSELILNIDKMLRRLIGEDIELVMLPAPDLGQVKADPGQLEQVLLNLAVNARDAMPGGGKLTIETANATLDEDYAQQYAEVAAGEYVLLSISDNGIGMTEEVKGRIFEPFFTTKKAGKGTGLGLATCFGIVKQSGGHIWVYSEVDQGTTFKIYLPRVAADAGSLPGPGQSHALPRGTETILLVEDEAAVRTLAARTLRKQGYTVLEAANGEEALYVARQHSGEIQLLFTDVVMPQMGGKMLASRLEEESPSTRVLFTSGYTDNAIVHHGVLEPGIAFLQKPFSPETLIRKVREVLDQ